MASARVVRPTCVMPRSPSPSTATRTWNRRTRSPTRWRSGSSATCNSTKSPCTSSHAEPLGGAALPYHAAAAAWYGSAAPPRGSAWLDVHGDFVELQVALEPLLHLVGDRVRRFHVRVAVDGDGDLGITQVGRTTRADAIGPFHPRYGLRDLPDVARRDGALVHEHRHRALEDPIRHEHDDQRDDDRDHGIDPPPALPCEQD